MRVTACCADWGSITTKTAKQTAWQKRIDFERHGCGDRTWEKNGVKQEMYRTIFSGMCTAVMGNIWRICVQFPWQSSVRNGIINVEIYHYRGQGEKSVYAWKHRGSFWGSNHCNEWRKPLNIDAFVHFELLKIGINSRVESDINAALTVASS